MRASLEKWEFAAAAFALLVICTCLFSHLSVLGLMGPDEPRYAFIARDMAHSGDWITPKLYGHPWFEKPVLYYWAAAGFFRLIHGAPETPARLPSALAALIATISMAWIGARLYGSKAAVYILLILPSSVAFIGFSRAATMDMLFSATLAVALASGAFICLGDRRSANYSGLFLFGFALGLATLAKGPAALILTGGSVAAWAVLSGEWRAALRLAHPAAIAVFCVVALPWYILCALRNPGFLRVFILQHNFERFLTPVFQHRQPFWFFVPILLIAIFPWTTVVVWLAADASSAVRHGQWRRSPGLFIACWVIFPLIFFSCSESKLPGYILPAVPPLGMLAAVCVLRTKTKPARCRAIFASIGACWIALAASAPVWQKKIPPAAAAMVHGEIILMMAAVVVAGVAIFSAGLTARALAATLVNCLVVMLLLQFVIGSLLPQLDPFLSARIAAHQVQSLSVPPALISEFKLQRDWQYGLNFYLDYELPTWDAGKQAFSRNDYVFADRGHLAELRGMAPSLSIVFDGSPKALLLRIPAHESPSAQR